MAREGGNCVLMVVIGLVATLFVSGCEGPNGRVYYGGDGGWGMQIYDVLTTPAEGPYYAGDSVAFTINTQPTAGGTMSYAWDLGGWATVDSGVETKEVTVTLTGLPGKHAGYVTVTETLGDGSSMSYSYDFGIDIASAPDGS